MLSSSNNSQQSNHNPAENLSNPYTLWGGLDVSVIAKDKIKLNSRIEDVIARQDKKIARLRTKREVLWYKMSTGRKKTKELIELQNKAQLLNVQIEEEALQAEALLRFQKKIFNCLDKFLEDLKEMHIPDGDLVAKRLQYEKSYHAVVDCLVEIDAFRKNKNSVVINKGIVLWSKIHQGYAEKLTEASGRLTLESSLAGFLFDKLSWGTKWSIDPLAPMKGFWIRMSKEITEVARGNSVIVHVLKGIDPRSAFWTEEAKNIIGMINDKTVSAIYLHIHTYQEGKKKRVMFVRNELPNADSLKKAKNNDAYIFTKKPLKLYHIRDGQAKELVIDASVIAEHSEIIKNLKSDYRPLDKRKLQKKVYKHLNKVIAGNPGHRGAKILKPPKQPIEIKTLEQLEKYLLIPDEDYIREQNGWQKLQSTKLDIAKRGFHILVAANREKAKDSEDSVLKKTILDFRKKKKEEAEEAAKTALANSNSNDQAKTLEPTTAVLSKQHKKSTKTFSIRSDKKPRRQRTITQQKSSFWSSRAKSTTAAVEPVYFYENAHSLTVAMDEQNNTLSADQLSNAANHERTIAPANFFALSDTVDEVINAENSTLSNRWINFGIACALHDLFDNAGNIKKEVQINLLHEGIYKKGMTLQEVNNLKPFLITNYLSQSGFINRVGRGIDSGSFDESKVVEFLAHVNVKLAAISSVDHKFIKRIKRNLDKPIPADADAPKLQKAINAFKVVLSKQAISTSTKNEIVPAKVSVAKQQEKKAISTGFFGFVKRHKKAILIGAFIASVIALGLVSFGVLSIAEVIVGTSIFALASTSVASVLSACGSFIAAHLGLTALAIGTKAAIGSSAIALGATAFGSTAGAIKGLVSDRKENGNHSATKKQKQNQNQHQNISDGGSENRGGGYTNPSSSKDEAAKQLAASDDKTSDDKLGNHASRLFRTVSNEPSMPLSSLHDVAVNAQAQAGLGKEKIKG